MKVKQLLCGVSLLVSSFGMSQGYSFSVSTETYTDLTGETSLNQGTVWDDPDFAIPLGFDFYFFTSNYSTLYITDDGLGGMLYDQTTPVSTTNIALFVPYGADIIDRGFNSGVSESDISYKIEGSPGNKIAKIQWKNVGFYSDLDDDNVSTDYTNFQMWLYEADGTIELRFGPSSVSQPELCYDGETGSFITFVPSLDYNTGVVLEEGFILSGDPSNPNFMAMNDINNLSFLSGTVPNETKYTFSHPAADVEEEIIAEIDFNVFPNPVNDVLHVNIGEQELVSLKVLNSLGQNVLESTDASLELNVETLDNGVYFVSIETKEGKATKKFVKK